MKDNEEARDLSRSPVIETFERLQVQQPDGRPDERGLRSIGPHGRGVCRQQRRRANSVECAMEYRSSTAIDESGGGIRCPSLMVLRL